MPIFTGAKIERLEQKEFGEIAYEVMRHIFEIHHELGRLFDESIYQRELACRVPDARTEVPIDVCFQDYRKTYYLDVLVSHGAIFELKAVESLTPRHRGQLLNYLLLAELAHGKLVNLRPERVEHEFVNTSLRRADRAEFDVADDGWQEVGTVGLKERMIAILRDWGTNLDLGLYEEAAAHFCRNGTGAETEVEVRVGDRRLGVQQVHLAAPNVAFRITGIPADRLPDLETHLHRFLEHSSLHAIQWINVTRPLVEFKTVQ